MRYFIIFYVFNFSQKGPCIFGSTILESKKFPNKKIIEEHLKKEYEREGYERYVHIINVNEVTEQDYKDWKE